MKAVASIPLLLSVLVGFVLGVVTWGALRFSLGRGVSPVGSHDEALLGLLAVAAFALGAFLTYALFGLGL